MNKMLKITFAAGVLLCGQVSAQQVLGNGHFEEWRDLAGTPPRGQAVGWGGSAPVRAPDLSGTGFSALLRGGNMIYQLLNGARSFPADFQISQTFVVMGGDGWQQPLWITLQETGPDGLAEGRHDWIQLRVAGSRGAFSIEANTGAEGVDRWQTIAQDVIEPSEYDLERNKFTTKKAFVITISRGAGNDSYAVSYGKVGEASVEIPNITHFAQPSNGSGRLAFISYSGVGADTHYWAAVSGVEISTANP
jgi:hypothetical protein